MDKFVVSRLGSAQRRSSFVVSDRNGVLTGVCLGPWVTTSLP